MEFESGEMAQGAKVLSLDTSDPHKNLLLLNISIIPVLEMGRCGGRGGC